MNARAVTPYLCVGDGRAALAWYAEAFGAETDEPWVAEDGRIGHAEFRIGTHPLYLSEGWPEFGVEPPMGGRGAPMSVVVEVDDCAAALELARDAGAVVQRELDDQGERVVATVVDPAGHRWMLIEER